MAENVIAVTNPDGTLVGTGANVGSNVVVTNFPDPQNVAGTVAVSNLPATQPVSGSVSVANFPSPQAVSGTVGVSNFPATQPISGTVDISNFPAFQAVTGTVSVDNFMNPQPVSGSVSVSNFPGTQSVNIVQQGGVSPFTSLSSAPGNQTGNNLDIGSAISNVSYYWQKINGTVTGGTLAIQVSIDGLNFFDLQPTLDLSSAPNKGMGTVSGFAARLVRATTTGIIGTGGIFCQFMWTF
jgi:hypothetical protein